MGTDWSARLEAIGIDPAIYLWDGSPCAFPGIRRYAGSAEIALFRQRVTASEVSPQCLALDDNDYPKHLWAFVFRTFGLYSWTAKTMCMIEIIFKVTEDEVDGGYSASALGYGIHTQGDSVEDVRLNVREAVDCHFDETIERPSVIRLHFVCDEIVTA